MRKLSCKKNNENLFHLYLPFVIIFFIIFFAFSYFKQNFNFTFNFSYFHLIPGFPRISCNLVIVFVCEFCRLCKPFKKKQKKNTMYSSYLTSFIGISMLLILKRRVKFLILLLLNSNLSYLIEMNYCLD